MGKASVNPPRAKLTNNDLFGLYQQLNSFKDLSGVKFNYAVARNIAKLKSETESLQKSIEVTEDYKAYDAQRVELAKKYAKKDEKGEPVIENNNYKLEDEKGFNKEVKDLQEKNKKTMDARAKQMKEFEALLKEESNVELYTIPLELVPESITTEQMKAILPLIVDEQKGLVNKNDK